MSAEILADRRVQLSEGTITFGEEQIAEALLNTYFPVTYVDDTRPDEVREIVAQLFDALEEKRDSEIVDLAEFIADGSTELLCSACADNLDQIDELAAYIIRSVPGEPSQDQGAVETAIRILKKQAEQIAQLTIVNWTVNDELREAKKYAPFTFPVDSGASSSGTQSSQLKDVQVFNAPQSLPASFTLKNDVPTPYQAPPSGTAAKEPTSFARQNYAVCCACDDCESVRAYDKAVTL